MLSLQRHTFFWKGKKKTTRPRFKAIKQMKQASDRDTTQVHAHHTMPMCEKVSEVLGEESPEDKVPSQLFTVIFSPALAKAAQLPFLLVLF